MLGLFGYVAYTSVTNWLNLDRAPNLIDATAEPMTNFVNLLQSERRAAVVYLSQPDAANLSAYQSAVTTTRNGEVSLTAALNSAGTKDSTTPQETAGIATMTSALGGLPALRTEVTDRVLTPLNALAAYTGMIADQGAVLQAEASSIADATAVEQGLGLISAVNTQEDVSEQDAVLAGALASGSLTAADRVAFSQAAG
ncbi:nitrate- and nitrite sensing domain-containing protein, partial [Trebonia sp.]|uniref:nitrate- and nitrite sensing domain-containing protein n=1 Tax=Trebonia sp. TaxID=2767075 RepID=UPI0026322104